MRPKLYETAEEMQEVIDAYLSDCLNNTRETITKDGELMEIPAPIPLSIEGLCDVLGMTRQSLMNYQRDDQFFTTIKKAKSRILRNQVENGLMGVTDKTMTIFLLKNNHGYTDKTEVEQTNVTPQAPIIRKDGD